MTEDELARLVELAEAATPGPWQMWPSQEYRVSGRSRTAGWVIEHLSGAVVRANAQAEDADGEYIAAVSPNVVLSLIGDLRAAYQAMPKAGVDAEQIRHGAVMEERARLLGNFDEFKEWMTDGERSAAAAVLFIHRPVDWSDDQRERLLRWGQECAAGLAETSQP